MRDLLAEVHHRAWTATAVAGALAVFCAAAHFTLPAVLAAMAAGAILMWTSEEENRVVAAMASVPAPVRASTPVPAPALVPAVAPAPAPAPSAPAPGPAPVVREWASPFPAARPARRQHPQQGRRARR
jgi:hypothetical protein